MGWRRLVPTAILIVGLLTPASAAAQVGDGDGEAPEGVTITEQVVTSFDGVPIVTTLFLPAGASTETPVPLVLRTHGWGGTRETSAGDGPAVDPTSGPLARLLDEGYAVLTWDSRGFGCSGGEVRIDDPDVEGRDVTALIDWAVDNAPVATDDDGDPLIGMSGGSYAGGIQMATAAVDDRLDALAPEIAWSDLRYSLYSGEVVNQGWVALLYTLGKASATGVGLNPDCPAGPQEGGLDPAIDRGITQFVTSGSVQDDTLEFFAKSSLAHYGQDRPTTVPTLVMQGSVDTLFDLTDGWGIYTHVREQGVDARFVAFCGGHVACPASYTPADDRRHLDDAIVAWFDRHLKGEDVDTGPAIEYRTNDGQWRAAADFPIGEEADHLAVAGSAEQLVVLPVVDIPDVEATLAELQGIEGIPGLPITTSQPSLDGDPRAATFPVAVADGGPLEIVGIPSVTLTISGVTAPLADVLDPVTDALGAVADGLEQAGELLVGPLRSVAGIVQGLGGVDQLAGLARPAAHVFVKLVDRETGEVLNLQEGAIAVDVPAESVTVEVPMPGLAYTLPEGHHLDLQVATHSLMHATGRVPALLDVEVAAAIPASGTAAPPADDDGTDDGADDSPDVPAPDAPGADDDLVPVGTQATPGGGDRPLPVTGGGTSLATIALLALVAAAALRRRPA